ncbi:YbaB/EbfC family nucleoid-associated protein [Actinophytocola glycyrrhizae]|uniref:YbaB/EbfC family nucleoid-associated protein n=1 Tax=Actinophytocola glycyrrhizae TaxID=2044873 RepID=A0ABV9SEI2_9PSEU
MEVAVYGSAGLPGEVAEQERMARAFKRVQEKLVDIEVTEESADGLIAATVGARGELRALDLDPRIYRTQDATALADDILATVRKAADTAGRRAYDTAAEVLPPHATYEDTDVAFDPVLHRLGARTRRR